MVSVFLEIATSIAGIAMSLAHVPQAYRIWKRKSSKDISLITYSIFFTGTFIWLAYGLYLSSWPIIVTYFVGAFSTTMTFGLAVYYRSKKQKQ